MGYPQLCHPLPDEDDHKIYYQDYIGLKGAGHRKGINIPHNAALFSTTRWVNTYYTSDFVGGQMKRIFGPGVKDLPVERKSAWLYPREHTDYGTGGNKNEALQELVATLRLNQMIAEQDEIEEG